MTLAIEGCGRLASWKLEQKPAFLAVRKNVFSNSLEPHETRVIEASEKVRLLIGNAGGVDITVNGVHQGRLGSTGQVLDAPWGRD